MCAVSRSRHRPLLTCVIAVVVLAACGGAPSPQLPTPMPVPTVRPRPTPTPTPPPTPEDELAAACAGTPVSWAAAYAGKVHPLVVIDTGWLNTITTTLERHALPADIVTAWYPINGKWLRSEWTAAMIQLVVCDAGDDHVVKVDSCGTYTRKSDGVRGKLLRERWTTKVRVVVARTGKTLQTKTISATVDDCPGAYTSDYGALADDPPWVLRSDEVTVEQVSAYASSVSKQSVR
ncbi:MAG: hypothetical protein ACYC65_12855 [Candidatus Limnocylindrales bacterium]